MKYFIRRLGVPYANFKRLDWSLWIGSLVLVLVSNLLSPEFDLLTLFAALIGVTSLMFAAKGSVWAQILMVAFSILYGIISWRFHYWGEMITYLCMALPMAVWSGIVWFLNPSKDDGNEVEINRIDGKTGIGVACLSVLVTGVFYVFLRMFHTPNLLFSTLSITTSFAAATLTLLRSSYFALFYAMNDLVLIVLWVLASVVQPIYIPVVVNFLIFFVNDLYGFVSWKKREKS